jgi:hypothetical protein
MMLADAVHAARLRPLLPEFGDNRTSSPGRRWSKSPSTRALR